MGDEPKLKEKVKTFFRGRKSGTGAWAAGCASHLVLRQRAVRRDGHMKEQVFRGLNAVTETERVEVACLLHGAHTGP